MSALQPVVGYRSAPGADREWDDDVVAGPPTGAAPAQLARHGYLYVVASGQGKGGDAQALGRLAVEALMATYYGPMEGDIRERLYAAFSAANDTAFAASGSGSLAAGSVTATAAVVRGDELWIGHVGDCRAYLVQRDSIRQLTRDHTSAHVATGSAGRLDHTAAGREGIATAPGQSVAGETRSSGPYERRLTRALGFSDALDVDILVEAIRSGDRVLLCTRGLSDVLNQNELLRSVRKLGPRRAPESLVELALSRNPPDSATALVLSAPGAPSPGSTLPSLGGSSATIRAPKKDFTIVSVEGSGSRKALPLSRSTIVVSAAAVLLAIFAPRLSDSLGRWWPVVTEQAPRVVDAASRELQEVSWPSLPSLPSIELPQGSSSDAPQTASDATAVAATPGALAPASVEEGGAPAQTATALLAQAEMVRSTAEAESTRILSTAVVAATHSSEKRRTEAAAAALEDATRTAIAGAGATATPVPVPAARSASVVLTQPVKGAGASGQVLFDWSWGGKLLPGQAFDVRVCKHEGCVPVVSKGLPNESPWPWCPDEGTGAYRWQVSVVTPGAMQPSIATSGIGQFVWTGGAPCVTSGGGGDGDEEAEPSPEPTKPKAPPPVKPTQNGP